MEEVENMLYQNDTITLDIPLKFMAVFDIHNEDIEKWYDNWISASKWSSQQYKTLNITNKKKAFNMEKSRK